MAHLSSIKASAGMKARLRQKFWQWISRRSPRAKQVLLQHNSIYVLPTRQGLAFIVVIAVMWLLGTNYQNNLILASVFLLVSMMIVSIIHAYKNLSGLQFQAQTSRSAFAGEYAEFTLLLNALTGRFNENISVAIDPSLPVTVDLIDTREQQIALAAHTRMRGWFSPERILVKTYYPLGLMRAWSWVHLDAQVLVYPAPLASDEPPLMQKTEQEGDVVARANPEDYYGLMQYRPGMPLARVAWKQFARGSGLHSKDYVGTVSHDVWLDWDELAGLDTETRLSRLCYWALEFGKTPTQYGLRLPRLIIEPGSGVQHQEAVLRALALYQDAAGQDAAGQDAAGQGGTHA